MSVLNILNSDLWNVITYRKPEQLSERALKELWFNLLGYVTEVNEHAGGTALVIIQSEKTGRWRALDGFDLPFHITGRPVNFDYWDQYAEYLKERFPAWYATDVIEGRPFKRGTIELDAWVRVHETVKDALDSTEVRKALISALDLSAGSFQGDGLLEDMAAFCLEALSDPVFRPYRP